ncbi:RNA polymerase sigma-I factor [Acetivibrio cellulolyticus]|uniref:RNA polymerase sigma-I factor n=1 Tax=Acetivibrio cellulolyticus TaxID=35830 RepID=UPI0001E304BC|nr:RNA polymerase sigma-I factor [Acetivibrio cellulolyticus]
MLNLQLYNKLIHEKESLIEIIRKIKNGDLLLRNKFIDDYKPFILKCVSQITGKKNNLVHSDEYSIALIAFNEAIECYDIERKSMFTKFSSQVMKRRIIDYMRSTKKNDITLPFSYFSDSSSSDFEEKYLHDISSDYSGSFDVKEEIKNLELKMLEYKITIEDLISCSPKHNDTRRLCLNVAKIVVENDLLYQILQTNKTLPYKELTKRINLCQRTLEKNRKFIIAMVFVLRSDMDVLKNYIADTIGR